METRKYNEKYVEGSTKGLENSRDTIKLKGLNSRILKQSKKQDKEHNRLIKSLITTKIYNNIYDRWMSSINQCYDKTDEDFEKYILNNLSNDDVEILQRVDYCKPTELKNHFRTLDIVEYDISPTEEISNEEDV